MVKMTAKTLVGWITGIAIIIGVINFSGLAKAEEPPKGEWVFVQVPFSQYCGYWRWMQFPRDGQIGKTIRKIAGADGK